MERNARGFPACGARGPLRRALARVASPGAPLALALAAGVLLAPSAPRAADGGADAVIGGTPVGETPLGSARVIGGVASAPGRWPSVVALVRAGSSSPADRQFCGGTVIAPRWIMTAAHCLYDAFRREVRPADVRVVSGVTDLRAERAEERVVVGVYVHPDYDHVAQDAYDDIALIEVATEFDVPAASLFAGDSESLAFAPGVVVGWGATEFTTPRRATYPDALHDAVVPLVPRDTCNDPRSYAGYVGGGQLCAGFAEGGVDTCIGDSGGPLFVDTGERIEQVGVVSYGRGCAEPLFYGIYTDVAAYRVWIGEFVALPDAGVTPLEVERPRGSAGGGAPLPAAAPVARPDDTSPIDDPFEPIEETALPSDDDGLFGAADGLLWLGVLIGAFGLRRRASRR